MLRSVRLARVPASGALIVGRAVLAVAPPAQAATALSSNSSTSRPSSTAQADAPSVQSVKIHQRVRPLAVLFGPEKDGSGVLSQDYAESGTQPDWQCGSGMLQAAYFANAISPFSTASGPGSATSTSSWGGRGGFSDRGEGV
ncbi:MAG: hypothetical protein LH475_13875 [Cryobacterium sp.]|uniref:hypothetical protein n=1 Tax=unclassified Cryobacterium TaxID=2649013 RepID=UPI0018CB4422|nr:MULTISPECIES: hypothetical protein [unclassified Cryobacterium]MCY7405688.1 hypothetical protein [Cryobacterium sp.]MEC5155116.1 hypothetical protein [Cryobacterium sp. CAN_C3]